MVRRSYQGDGITVLWDSSRCIHSAICLRALPGVFDVERRPWVDIAAADAGAIATAIEQCPSGALRYERAEAPEVPDAPTTVVPWPDGPMIVRGDFEVRDRRGELFDAGYRMALCRCGHSQNQPFCDLSHREAGFRDHPRAVKPERADAEDPGTINSPG